MYCEFISGDVHSDIDVELNMQMARRCDSTKPMTLTNYKNSSENFGVIYCCNIKKEEPKKDDSKKVTPPVPEAVHPAATAKKDEDLDLDPSDDANTPTKPTNLNNPIAKPPASAPKAPAPAAAPAAKTPAPAAKSASAPAAKAAPATTSSAPASASPAGSTPSAATKPAPATASPTAPKTPPKTELPDADILGE